MVSCSQTARLRTSALAIFVMAGCLVMTVFAAGGAPDESTARSQPTASAHFGAPSGGAQERAAKRALVRSLPHFALIVLTFLVGSYVMVKVGRSFLARRERRVESRYVDAWSSYRLSDEEIKSAAGQLEEDEPEIEDQDDADDDDT